MKLTHASLFSGFGGADLAARWMGWENAFWCEIDDFCRTILSYWLPKSIGYGNIKETDFTPWRGKIDVLTGGFPCQPFSVAGQRKGAADDRYPWPEMLRAIREIRPTWVIGENVAGILSMVQSGDEITVESQASLFEETNKETVLEQEYVVETICRDIEQEGYSIQPIVIPACAVGAPHRRDRVWFIAYRADTGIEGVQREGKDRVYKSETATNPNHNDARRSRYEQVRCEEREGETQDGEREWVRSNTERACKEGITPNSNQFNGGLPRFYSGRLSKFEASRIQVNTDTECTRCRQVFEKVQSQKSVRKRFTCVSGKRIAPYTNREQLGTTLQSWNRIAQFANACRKNMWRDFPTQPPVCRGNDGFPFDVVRLTVSFGRWRAGSIKGYGNAIVPQVIYEIFKAIETTQK